MKQNVFLANSRQRLITVASIAVILLTSACVTIPRPAQSTALSRSDSSKPNGEAKININTASAEALEALPGVGRGIAERIVAHRQQYGAFRRPEHLMMVRGISDRKFRQLRAMISVE